MTASNDIHFSVHPTVVFQLGEKLITDSVQAIIELIKNSYDADATYAKVIIDTKGITEIPNTIFSGVNGRILVEDDGFGMNKEEIISGWLRISNRHKRVTKEGRQTTPGGRTPLGDKGLGRLGVQRLGENLEIFTKKKSSPGYHFGFSWLDFNTAPTLQDVKVHFSEASLSFPIGTRIVISELKEVELWQGNLPINRLEKELARMISPYKAIRNFNVFVQVDGKNLELTEISEQLRELSPVQYSLDFDGRDLNVRGRAKLDFFRPQASKDREEFALLAEADQGSALLSYLEKQNLARDMKLVASRSNKWFVEFSLSKAISDLDQVERASTNGREIFNPGPFHGEIDAFDLGPAAYNSQNIFDGIRDFRFHVKERSGVGVYRDGFGIKMPKDWMRLGAQWTSAKSYYGLKPDTTLGYIALTAKENMDLEETTDREGFSDTPYHRNFMRLLEVFVKYTEKVQTFLGRSWNEFKKMRNEQLACVDSRKTVEELANSVKAKVTEASQKKKTLSSVSARLRSSVKEARSFADRAEKTNFPTTGIVKELQAKLQALEEMATEAEEKINEVEKSLDTLDAVKDLAQVLEDRVGSLRKQMDYMYETMALGLTAEALSHEMFNIADQLSRRAKVADERIKSHGIKDSKVLAFLEYVRSAVLFLRKQLSFLSPSLRYVRENREIISINSFVDEVANHFADRHQRKSICIEVKVNPGKELFVRMNRGKLTQIMDNFILNSEYWVAEEIRSNRISSGIIQIEVATPFIRISDNGHGIEPNVENSIFEPFISAKEKGRGLGLFIVKQLLASEGCAVGLLPDRNHFNRYFKFQIDFRGAMNE